MDRYRKSKIQKSCLIFFNIMKKAKKAKKNKVKKPKSYLSTLPDDVFLIVLQFCEKPGITKTRKYQSKWVQKCTMYVVMRNAIIKENLDSMKWIKERDPSLDLVFKKYHTMRLKLEILQS